MSSFTAQTGGTYLVHDHDVVTIDLTGRGAVTLVGGGANFNQITIDYSGKNNQADYVEVDLSTFTGDIQIELKSYDSSDEIKLLGAQLTGPVPGYPDRMGFTYVGADGNTYTGQVELDDEYAAQSFSSDPSPIIICFAEGTMLATPTGTIAVEDLCEGDELSTDGGDTVTARWIGQRKVGCLELMRFPSLRPIRIEAGALGPGVPASALTLSPQHRLEIRDYRAALYFGQGAVLAPAAHLVNGRTIRRSDTATGVTYYHVFTGAHDILIANGAPAESLYLGKMAARSLTPAALCELGALFPELFTSGKPSMPSLCGPTLGRRDCALLTA